ARQGERATITGTVTDVCKATIPDANIVLPSAAANGISSSACGFYSKVTRRDFSKSTPLRGRALCSRRERPRPTKDHRCEGDSDQRGPQLPMGVPEDHHQRAGPVWHRLGE